MKQYLCIDLKCFYASVECILLNYDPFKVPLAVCDISRGNGAICLAVSPYLKSLGVSSRSRLYDIDVKLRDKIIFVKPRMKKYIEYSSKVYNCYLDFFSESDIHVYSIDESFIDVSSYLNYYKLSSYDLALRVIKHVYQQLGLTCCAGVGDNMFLAKVSLDILAKKTYDGVHYLNENSFLIELSKHRPLSDFWSIGIQTQKRLHSLGCYCLGDVVSIGEKKIVNEFGVLGYELFQHALGKDDATIFDVKNYTPASKSISSSQILFRDYHKQEAITVLLEMTDNLVLKLIGNNLRTKSIGFVVGYSKDVITPLCKSYVLYNYTNSYQVISQIVKSLYYHCVDDVPIRKISLTFSKLTNGSVEQLDLFRKDNKDEVSLYKAINDIKNKYGKNAVNKALSLTDAGTQFQRNKLVGGHSGE